MVDLADGDLARRMKRQNNGLRKIVATGLPFVTYKYAMTLDGRLATDAGDSRWISSAESRALVHQWRAWSDAVVVGAGTVRADDPQLTAREVECHRQPLRVVVGGAGALHGESALVRSVAEGPVLVVDGNDLGEDRRAELRSWRLEVVTAGRGRGWRSGTPGSRTASGRARGADGAAGGRPAPGRLLVGCRADRQGRCLHLPQGRPGDANTEAPCRRRGPLS